MGRPRQPIDVVVARGKSHKTKAEIEERRRREVKPVDTKIIAPDFLTAKKDRDKFVQFATLLKNLNVWSELDADTLGKYIIAQATYEACIKHLTEAMEAKEYQNAASIQRQQDRAFRQAHTCASALGLTISSRCKLVVPNADDEDIPDL